MDRPLEGLIPFVDPSDTIVLFDGVLDLRQAHGAAVSGPGRIVLQRRASSVIRWGVDLGGEDDEVRLDWALRVGEPTTLSFDFHGTRTELDVHHGYLGGGTLLRGMRFGGERPLRDVITHWVNLVPLPGSSDLESRASDQTRTVWRGRWEMDIEGWSLTIDERSDVRAALQVATREQQHVVTHVMRVARRDGASFFAADAMDVVERLHVAFSFMLGRWVAPVLSVGHDESRRVGWSEWAPFLLDSPSISHGRWWAEHRPQDLSTYLEAFLAAWADADVRDSLSYALHASVAASGTGYTEQRLQTAVSALGRLHWLQYGHEGSSVTDGLRRLLHDARVDTSIDAARQPELAAYAERHIAKPEWRDGPGVVVQLRNEVTHPKHSDPLLESPRLLPEASRLASRYLDLALLRLMGYTGSTVDRTFLTSVFSATGPVPWATVDS